MNVLANDGISKEGVDRLNSAGFKTIVESIDQSVIIDFINNNNIEVLLVRSATKVRKDLIDSCENLKIIGIGGVGMDNIDVSYAKENGIHVINTPAASSISVAELVFSHLFSCVRSLHISNREMPLDGDKDFKKLKKNYSGGSELKGKTLGVVGFGRIGQEVAKIGLGIGMNIIFYDLHNKEANIKIDFFDGSSKEFVLKSSSFEELLRKDQEEQAVLFSKKQNEQKNRLGFWHPLSLRRPKITKIAKKYEKIRKA